MEDQGMKTLIWGTGRRAVHYVKIGGFSGNEIVGFVDSFPRNELFMGYKVYRPEDVSQLDYDYLVVSVKKDCSTILKTCVAEKFDLNKIFFASEEQDLDGEEEKIKKLLSLEEIRNIFPIMYRDIIGKKENQIYYCSQLISEKLEDHAIIKNYGDSQVIAWIPIELLFSAKKCPEEFYGKLELQEQTREHCPIIAFEIYRNLYQFFMQGKSYPDKYCQWYQNSYMSEGMYLGLTDEQVIGKRFREFEYMQRKLNKGMEFFVEHPAVAEWNTKGYFTLTEGHHEVCFLYLSGRTRMPVQITQKDYNAWCNTDVAEEVHRIILDQNRTEFYQPILNPYFSILHPFREGYTKSRLHHLLEYFGDRRFTDKKIVDIGANLGYMGQAFRRMGAEVTLFEFDPYHYELLEKIDKLLYTDCRIVKQKFEEYDSNEKYDVAILLTVFHHYFSDNEVRDRFIRKLNECIKQMLIWESGDFPEEERNYILQHTKFHNYQHICYTYATGKFRELGLYMIDDSEYLHKQ